jgi:hypothetical protein
MCFSEGARLKYPEEFSECIRVTQKENQTNRKYGLTEKEMLMKIRKMLALVAAGVLLSGSSVLAIQYSDNNPADTRLDADYLFGLNPLYNPSYTGQWDLLSAGYNPITQRIDSAVATFLLNDANGGQESYSITIGGSAFLTGGSFTTTLLGTIGVGDPVTGSALITLDSTGLLNYTVTANSGVFWLANANLTAQASDRKPLNPANVPDGGATAGLLGLGLLVLAGAKRHLALK